MGDFWTWVALDAETRIVPSYLVGKRDAAHARAFMIDLASRLTNCVHISSAALRLYVDAVEAGFGGDVDYATVVKTYEAVPIGPGRCSPAKVTSVEKAENLRAAVDLQFANYNLCRKHGTLGTTPASAAGVATRALALREIVGMAEW